MNHYEFDEFGGEMDGMGAVNDIPAAANAFASAFVADIEAAPSLKAELLKRNIKGDGLTRIVMRDLDRYRRRLPGPALFPNLRKVSKMFLEQEGYYARNPNTGMGQWDAIAGVIGAAAGAASSIYSSVTNTQMQKDLLRLQQQRNTAAIQIAELQAKTSQAQLAAANVAASGVPSTSILSDIGGWPTVGIAGAGIAAAIAIFFATRGR